MSNKYGFSGSTQGLNAPASWGEKFGSNTGNSAFAEDYSSGQGINPYGLSLYGSTPALDNMPSSFAPMGLGGGAMPGNGAGGLGDWFKSSGFLDSTDINTGIKTGGWGAPAIQGVGALINGFMGMKQYGLSKKIFENNKQQFERNFSAQKGITNSQLSDRQDRRNADARANGQTGTTSTADYMSKWGVK